MIMAGRLVEITRSLRNQRIGTIAVHRESPPQLQPYINVSCNYICLAVIEKDKTIRNLNTDNVSPKVRHHSTAAWSDGVNQQNATDSRGSRETNLEQDVPESAKTESVNPMPSGARGDTGDGGGARDDSTVEEMSAGDLSDCPPALQEFVFSSPHPLPFTVDPELLQPSQIKAAIDLLFETRKPPEGAEVYSEATRWCAGEGMKRETGDEKWLQYPEPNSLWPNPLLHNHRLQPFTCTTGAAEASKRPAGSDKEVTKGVSGQRTDSDTSESNAFHSAVQMDKLQLHLNRLRLEQLWKYSGVHGISWDEIDEVYLKFRHQQKEQQQRWESRKQQLLEYAGIVCARRLRAQRLEFVKSAGVELDALDEETREQLLVPRSLFRRMTRRLFYKWHDEYFSPWRPGGLQAVLKAHITLRMLQRETNERFIHLDPPTTPAKDAGQAESEVPDGATRRFPPPERSDSAASLEENLRKILRRSYMQKPLGARRSKQFGAEPRNDESGKADVERVGDAEQADGRTWDFAGVGRRSCKAVPTESTRE